MAELLQVQEVITDPVQRAIQRLQCFCPSDGYWIAFSGGKDSQAIYHLAQDAGVRFDAHYNATTVDPPELVRFIKEHYPQVSIDKPDRNMVQLIASHKMPPTRRVRYCCQDLKERGGDGRVVVTGVRWAESARRKSQRGVVELNAYTKKPFVMHNDNSIDRQMVESCPIKSKHLVNPIVDWQDKDVWQYLRSRNIEYCKLYDEGLSRLGCVGCPLAGEKRQRLDFERWPHFRKLYLRAFAQMLQARSDAALPTQWCTPEEVMAWWLREPEYPMFDEVVDDN